MSARKEGHRITFLRLPADLREQVDRAAADGFRPMGSEIEMRLRRSFTQHDDVPVNPSPRRQPAT
jgi:Arc-like DNA binding domain